MSTDSHHSRDLQRKFVRILIAVAAIVIIAGVPLVIFDDFRLDLAHQMGLAPGRGAEQLAHPDDGATLVVLPLGEYDGTGQERYLYKAQFIGRPAVTGTELTDIETGTTVDISLSELEFIAADATGEHVLFRGPSADSGSEQAVLVNTTDLTAEVLPQGQLTPTIGGDWETPVWAKTSGICDRYSPEQKFVACFNRADAASYLAGDWQIDVQLYGDYNVVEPVYRGAGSIPIVGFANDDTWIYFQNEAGIWRIEIPESLQDKV